MKTLTNKSIAVGSVLSTFLLIGCGNSEALSEKPNQVVAANPSATVASAASSGQNGSVGALNQMINSVDKESASQAKAQTAVSEKQQAAQMKNDKEIALARIAANSQSDNNTLMAQMLQVGLMGSLIQSAMNPQCKPKSQNSIQDFSASMAAFNSSLAAQNSAATPGVTQPAIPQKLPLSAPSKENQQLQNAPAPTARAAEFASATPSGPSLDLGQLDQATDALKSDDS